MANRIIEKYFEKFDLDKQAKKILAEIVDKTNFKIDKEIWRGTILEHKDKVGTLIYSGKYKNKKTILKIQILKPVLDETKILEKFRKNNKSKIIQVQKIFVSQDWSAKKGYGYFIAEHIDYPKIYPSGLITKKQMQEFCYLFEEYKTKIKTKHGWFPREKYEKTTLNFISERLKHWIKMTQHNQKLDEKIYLPQIKIYKKIFHKYCKNQPIEWVHGHLSPHDILKVNSKKYYLVSNFLWSYRPKWYELAFNMWVNINNLGLDVNFKKLDNYIKECFKYYKQIPIVKKDKNFEKWFKLNLLERAIGSILVDYGARYFPKSKQKFANHTLKLWIHIFDKFSKEL